MAEETRERGPPRDGPRTRQEARSGGLPAARTLLRSRPLSLGHRFGEWPAADPAPWPRSLVCPAGSRAFPAPARCARASAFVFSGLFSVLFCDKPTRGFPFPFPGLPRWTTRFAPLFRCRRTAAAHRMRIPGLAARRGDCHLLTTRRNVQEDQPSHLKDKYRGLD